jgi:hypothetical protein
MVSSRAISRYPGDYSAAGTTFSNQKLSSSAAACKLLLLSKKKLKNATFEMYINAGVETGGKEKGRHANVTLVSLATVFESA